MLKKYFSSNALEEMLTTLDPFIDLINVISNINICRDPKDDFLFALAKGGRAKLARSKFHNCFYHHPTN